ncbi:accessory gene regulator B family protein [Paenibacillus sedimenti]|uniref:Accessory gene regulator B family protein n=1 Tax=Paenibacillus sedimenti TaxID=2770274 RepID=A0A926KNS2_9BACL|nr:accessory gene regulator B family protein [Paenibacillus sedimenti]MBD0381120.1 accessory gene regulator B family protein [Paenibacillus sedimenti]
MKLIDRWIFQIADFSINNNPNSPSRDSIVFVFRLLAIIMLTTLITLLACGVTGHLYEGFLIVAATILIKVFIGSLHFRSIVLCTIVSSLSMIILAFLPKSHSSLVLYILSGIAIVLIYLYAPKNIVVFMRLRQDQIPHLKWVAIFLVVLNMWIQIPLFIDAFLYHVISITPVFEYLFRLIERRTSP